MLGEILVLRGGGLSFVPCAVDLVYFRAKGSVQRVFDVMQRAFGVRLGVGLVAHRPWWHDLAVDGLKPCRWPHCGTDPGDPDRGPQERSWSSLAGQHSRRLDIVQSLTCMPPGSVADVRFAASTEFPKFRLFD